MSVKAAIRPSALPLPKTTSSQSLSSYDRKCMLPVAVDRNRRAGSDPRAGSNSISNSNNSNSSTTSSSTSNIPRNALIRSGSIRSTTSNQEKTHQITSTNKESNKENNKANKDGSDRSNRSKSIIINNNNINSAKTKGLFLNL